MSTSFQVHLSKKVEIEDAIKNMTRKKLRQIKKEKEDARFEIKDKQKNLTENLTTAYSAIKPTIIQAQRILKIVDALHNKIDMTKYLNYEFLSHFVDELSLASSNLQPLVEELEMHPRTMKYMGEIARIQHEIYNLKAEDYQSVSEVDFEEEEEDSFRREEDEFSEKEPSEEENEEDRAAKEERIEKVLQYREELSGKFRNFLRFLAKNPNEMTKVKQLNGSHNEEKQYIDAMDCMASLRMIYLKKLSTGYDEDQQHQKQLEELLDKIERYKATKEKKRDELSKLRKEKDKYRIEQNEIKAKLEKDLIGVQEKKEATKKKLEEECESELALEKKNHDDHVSILKNLKNFKNFRKF